MALPLQFYSKRSPTWQSLCFCKGWWIWKSPLSSNQKLSLSLSNLWAPQSGDFVPKMTFYAHFMLHICPPEHTKSGTNFFINGFDPPPRFITTIKKQTNWYGRASLSWGGCVPNLLCSKLLRSKLLCSKLLQLFYCFIGMSESPNTLLEYLTLC